MAWSLKGSYAKTCSCELMCPCNLSFDHGATYDFCRATLAFNVRAGQIEGTAMDGRKLRHPGRARDRLLPSDHPGHRAGHPITRAVTRPEALQYRRRELGEVISRAVLAAGRDQGCEIGVMQASPMGRPAYEQMGFETVTQYHHFVPAG